MKILENINPANKHAEALKIINDDFFISEIVLKEKGLIFDTNHINYWTVTRDNEMIYISPNGLQGFVAKRKTKLFDDIVDLNFYTTDYFLKYRKGDMLYFIEESFGLSSSENESDLSKQEKIRFFEIAKRLLNFLNEDINLLEYINPRTMHAVTLGELLYTMIGKVLVRLKDNREAVKDLSKLMQEYDDINKRNQFDNKKFYILLDGLEIFVDKFEI